jgi:hypothetical protein
VAAGSGWRPWPVYGVDTVAALRSAMMPNAALQHRLTFETSGSI